MNEVWVVWKSYGYYEDYHINIAGIRTTEESAKSLAEYTNKYNSRPAPMDEDEYYKSYDNIDRMDTESRLLMEDMAEWINDRWYDYHPCTVEKFEVLI